MMTAQQAKVWDTTLPTLNGRRLWQAPALRSHAMLVMTAARLHLVPAHVELSPQVRTRIDAGAALDDLLPAATDVVFLPDLLEAELDLSAFTLHLTTADRDCDLHFADAETADDVFVKLLHRTHRLLRLSTDHPNALRLVRGPLGVMSGLLIATLTLALTVSAAADLTSPPGDPTAALPWLDEWLHGLARLDWRWVCGLGGAACAWAQLALIRRLRQPPTRLRLSRSDSFDIP